MYFMMVLLIIDQTWDKPMTYSDRSWMYLHPFLVMCLPAMVSMFVGKVLMKKG